MMMKKILFQSREVELIRHPGREEPERSNREGRMTKQKTEITEEDIALEMVEHDFVVRMPPKKEYKICVSVRSIRKTQNSRS